MISKGYLNTIRSFIFFRMLFVLSAIFPLSSIIATPYQLISNESALIISHLNLEIKEDAIYSKSYINDWGLRTQIRTGFWGWSEISFATSFNYFPDLRGTNDLFTDYYTLHKYDVKSMKMGNPRIAFIEPKLKIRVIKLSSGTDIISYFKYRYYNGIPVIIAYPSKGKDPDAIGMVSPVASEGSDFILGFIARKSFKQNKYFLPMLMAGGEGVYLKDKAWQENRRRGKYMVAATFSPQVIIKNLVMIQVENRFEYWIGRGWRYEALPGIRWEIQWKTIIELGVGIPVLGADISRFIVGFTYEFGTSFGKSS